MSSIHFLVPLGSTQYIETLREIYRILRRSQDLNLKFFKEILIHMCHEEDHLWGRFPQWHRAGSWSSLSCGTRRQTPADQRCPCKETICCGMLTIFSILEIDKWSPQLTDDDNAVAQVDVLLSWTEDCSSRLVNPQPACQRSHPRWRCCLVVVLDQHFHHTLRWVWSSCGPSSSPGTGIVPGPAPEPPWYQI